MKKQKNATRVIAIVLVLLMALALLPIAASAQAWTITYDPNGATGTAYVQNTDADGKATILGLTDTGFSYPHHSFVNWNGSSDGGATPHAPGEAVTLTDHNWTIYAIWEQIKVSVSFDGGAHGSGMPADTNLDAGSTYTVPSDWTGTKDAGWALTGWTMGGSAVGSTIELPDTNVTLVAQWEMENPVAITFDDNGGSGGPGSMIAPAGVATALPTTTPTWSGHNFLGWDTDEYATVPTFTVPGTIVASAATTLYAIWEEDLVTIKYEAGANGHGTPSQETRMRGTSLTLPTASAKGLSPDSGYLSSEKWIAGGVTYKDGDNYDITAASGSEVTFVAQFAEACTLEFQTNGGSAVPSETKAKGSTVILPSTSKSGSNFKGWYENASYSGTCYQAGDSYTIQATQTLYARWVSSTIPVTFDPNGGSGTMAETTANRGADYTLPTSGFIPPSAKKFKAWTVNGDTTEYAPGYAFAVPDEGLDAIVLHAQWEDDHIEGTVTVSGEAKVGATLSATASISYPTPAGTVKYQWWRSDDGVTWTVLTQPTTGNTHVIEASSLGKYLRCTVTCSNKPGSALTSNMVGPVTADTVQMTVTQSPVTGSVTLTYSDGTVIATVTAASTDVPVMKNTTVTLTVTPPSGKVVKTVGGKKPAATYDFNLSADTTVDVIYVDSGSHDPSKITVYPSKEPTSESTDPDSLTAKALALSAIGGGGDAYRNRAAVYDIIICYNNNPSDPVTDPSLLAAQSFTLRFPSTVKKGNFGKGTYEEAWDFAVFHYSGGGISQVVSGLTYNTASVPLKVTVTGQTSVSPFVATAKPKSLDGTVVLAVGGEEIGSSANVSVGQTLSLKEVRATNAVDNSFHYTWVYSNGSPIPGAQADTPYTVQGSDMGKSIKCLVTHDVQTGYIQSAAHPVTGKPGPTVLRHIVNDGDELTGVIGSVTAGMQYIRSDSTPDPYAAGWRDCPGTAVSGLRVSGKYYVRFKGDTNPNNWATVTVDDYYTVKCLPDSVSGNRLWFSASGTYVSPYTANVWLVKKGTAITVTATTRNTNYFKVTSLTTSPYVVSKTGKADSLSITIAASKTTVPYIVYGGAGVYGSKTGDTSHLELWIELATLSMMGLCAAAVFGRKKLKKEK